MKVALTDRAAADLMDIADFIGRLNPARASTFVDELERRCEGLADTPRAYPIVPGWKAKAIRRRRHGDYLIFYRESGDRIEVLHVLHGARNDEAILSPTA